MFHFLFPPVHSIFNSFAASLERLRRTPEYQDALRGRGGRGGRGGGDSRGQGGGGEGQGGGLPLPLLPPHYSPYFVRFVESLQVCIRMYSYSSKAKTRVLR